MELSKNTSWVSPGSEVETKKGITFTNFVRDLELESKFGQEWNDPYDSIWLKLATIIVFAIQVMFAGIMLAFVYYETNGLAGHYRTIINQLLSYLYGGVSPSTIVQCIGSLIYISRGPLSEPQTRTKFSLILVFVPWIYALPNCPDLLPEFGVLT